MSLTTLVKYCFVLLIYVHLSIDDLQFTWDENKNRLNQKKHKVSFQEAQSVFYDEQAKLINDSDHSKDEDRFILLGLSSTLKVLVVIHAYREDDEIIRIISARKATKTESKTYKKGD